MEKEKFEKMLKEKLTYHNVNYTKNDNYFLKNSYVINNSIFFKLMSLKNKTLFIIENESLEYEININDISTIKFSSINNTTFMRIYNNDCCFKIKLK